MALTRASRDAEHPEDALTVYQAVADEVLETADRRASQTAFGSSRRRRSLRARQDVPGTSRSTSPGCGSGIAVGRL